MKISKSVFLAIISILIIFSVSCIMPSASIPSDAEGTGSIALTIREDVSNARNLLPVLDMTPASYTISGSGPSSATFTPRTVTAASPSATIPGLADGAWAITVQALNAAGTAIGSGSGTATVTTGETATVSITVTPLSGNGTLTINLTWPSGVIASPAVVATLTPTTGGSAINSTSASVATTSGSLSWSSIPVGYYTLSIQLMDGTTIVAGAGKTDIVRIVADQTTSGTYTWAVEGITINITPDLAAPFVVSITGGQSTMTAGAILNLTASVSNPSGTIIFVWYVDGISQNVNTSTWSGGSAWGIGYHTIDVTAISSDGKKAGSATLGVQVGGTSVYPTCTDEQAKTACTAFGNAMTDGMKLMSTSLQPANITTTTTGGTASATSPDSKTSFTMTWTGDIATPTLVSMTVELAGYLDTASGYALNGTMSSTSLTATSWTANGDFDLSGTGPVQKITFSWTSSDGAAPTGFLTINGIFYDITMLATPDTIAIEPTAQVATPTFDPPAGMYPGGQQVSISSATAGATIKYTTDGSDPVTSATSMIGTTVNLATSMTIKAYASKDGMTASSVAGAAYATSSTPAYKPDIADVGTALNAFYSLQDSEMSALTPDIESYLNGDAPTWPHTFVYDSHFSVSVPCPGIYPSTTTVTFTDFPAGTYTANGTIVTTLTSTSTYSYTSGIGSATIIFTGGSFTSPVTFVFSASFSNNTSVGTTTINGYALDMATNAYL